MISAQVWRHNWSRIWGGGQRASLTACRNKFASSHCSVFFAPIIAESHKRRKEEIYYREKYTCPSCHITFMCTRWSWWQVQTKRSIRICYCWKCKTTKLTSIKKGVQNTFNILYDLGALVRCFVKFKKILLGGNGTRSKAWMEKSCRSWHIDINKVRLWRSQRGAFYLATYSNSLLASHLPVSRTL